MKNEKISFQELYAFVQKLRSECPWDSKQTFESLRPLFIEEVYEATSVTNNAERCDELGDILFHILLQTAIANEQNQFTINDVVKSIFGKLQERHPEISFGKSAPELNKQVSNWHEIKRKKKKGSLLSQLNSKAMPALVRAFRIQKLVSTVGFDWKNKSDALKKVYEEFEELDNSDTPKKIEEEFGDLLFAIVNYSRFLKIDSEIALQMACDKFNLRFTKLEESVNSSGKTFENFNLEELDEIWDKIKSQE